MMDGYLRLQNRDLGHRLDPEVLQALADNAATLHVERGVDLTSAVLGVIRGKALNPAHVCRVTEMANQKAYLKLYDLAKGPSRMVEFEGGPARIFDILDETFSKADGPTLESKREEPVMDDKYGMDYLFAPVDARTRDEMPQQKVAAEEIFADRMTPDVAARMLGRSLNSPGGRTQMFYMLKDASERAAQDIAGLRTKLANSANELVKMADTAVREGWSPEEVARVMYDAPVAGSDMAALIIGRTFEKLGMGLDPDRIPWARQPAANHPLSLKVADIVKTAAALQDRLESVQNLNEQLTFVRGRLSAE